MTTTWDDTNVWSGSGSAAGNSYYHMTADAPKTTASGSGTFSDQGFMRSNTSKTTGKVYFEILFTGHQNTTAGYINSGFGLSTNLYDFNIGTPGFDGGAGPSSVSWIVTAPATDSPGKIYSSGFSAGQVISALAVGDIIVCAADLTHLGDVGASDMTVWLNIWRSSAFLGWNDVWASGHGTQNPATSSGGFSLLTDNIFWDANHANPTSAFIVCADKSDTTSAASFTVFSDNSGTGQAIPSGFSAWETSIPPPPTFILMPQICL